MHYLKNNFKLIILVATLIIVATIFAIIIINKLKYVDNDEGTKVENNSNVVINKQRAKSIDLQSVIKQNQQDVLVRKIEKTEKDIEFKTQYRKNNSLAKGKMQTIQEGQDGKQNAIVKNTYKNGQLVSSEDIATEVIKTTIDRIVDVGTAAVSDTYVPIVGDELKATVDTISLRKKPTDDSEELAVVRRDEKVNFKAKDGDWYYVEYNSKLGWINKQFLKYYDQSVDDNYIQYSKEQLTQDLGISILLNKKSGLKLDQFKKILTDVNDKKKVLEDNAEYFYYAENQYNINGVFVAAVAIHESRLGSISNCK